MVGVGLNVSAEPGELPPPGPGALAATSLRIAASAAPASLARKQPPRSRGRSGPGTLLIAILADFERWYQAWCRAGGDPERSGLRAEYTRLSGTIGRRVRVELPGGQLLSGLAVGVDPTAGCSSACRHRHRGPVAAGNVVHLR